MKNEKNIKINFLILISLVFMLSACEIRKENKVSEGVQEIIEAMMNCPNSELYSHTPGAIIGDNADTEELKEIQEENQKKNEIVYQNWENRVGKYFSEESLKDFLETGPAFDYLLESEVKGIEIKPDRIELIEKGEYVEKVQIFFKKNDVVEECTMQFKYDSDGLIYKVECEY